MNKNTKEEKTPTRSGRRWTEAEVEDLYWYWGMYSIPTIAKRLNRSVGAIKDKVTKLGLGYAIRNSSMIPLSAFIAEFGYHTNSLDAVAKKLTIAGFKIHGLRVEKKTFRMVSISEFWQFAEHNTHLFDFSKLQEGAFGNEPDWVKKVRKEHYNVYIIYMR